jgi:hypothetical protein
MDEGEVGSEKCVAVNFTTKKKDKYAYKLLTHCEFMVGDRGFENGENGKIDGFGN